MFNLRSSCFMFNLRSGCFLFNLRSSGHPKKYRQLNLRCFRQLFSI